MRRLQDMEMMKRSLKKGIRGKIKSKSKKKTNLEEAIGPSN